MKMHGKSRTPEYRAWVEMKRRCSATGRADWPKYGGRGISVCDRWSSFEVFLCDMGPKPTASHSLDRINNDGNYEPGNCRWATASQQLRNQSKSIMIAVNGRKISLADAADAAGLSLGTVRSRLSRGWSPDHSLQPISPENAAKGRRLQEAKRAKPARARRGA